MATLSPSDYKDLNPYKDVVNFYHQHGVYVGMDILSFKPIYERIAREQLNTGCSACISNALKRTYDLIKEYEADN